MRARIVAFIAMTAFATLASAPAARVQELYTVSVTNYQPIPAGTTYVIDMNEDTELTSTAEQALRDGLDRRGLHYDPNATFGFKIGTAREYSTPNTDASFDTSNTIVNIPLNSGDVRGAPKIGHIYRITLNVYNRASGDVLSRGDVTDTSINADPVGATPMMVEELLDKVAF